MTYREIETTLDISGTSTHSILHEHLTVKKNNIRSHTICQSINKRLVVIVRKKCSKNTIAVLWNTSITSWQVINRGFTRMSLKVNSSRLYGCFKMSQIQQKLLAHEAFPVFSEKLDISQSFHKNNAEQSILSGTQPFDYQLSSKKSGNPTFEDGSLFITTMWALTHRLKQLHFWALKTSIWWVISRIVLTWHST